VREPVRNIARFLFNNLLTLDDYREAPGPAREPDRARPANEDRTPAHRYEPTREAEMAAFAKSWRRE
jgi:hypothetical protein